MPSQLVTHIVNNFGFILKIVTLNFMQILPVLWRRVGSGKVPLSMAETPSTPTGLKAPTRAAATNIHRLRCKVAILDTQNFNNLTEFNLIIFTFQVQWMKLISIFSSNLFTFLFKNESHE